MPDDSEDLSINNIADDFEEENDISEEEREEAKEKIVGGDEPSNQQGVSGAQQNQQDPYDINVDDIPDDKREKWIDQMLFQEYVTDEREIAGGDISLELKISTGETDVEVFDTVRNYVEKEEDKSMEDFSDSELNTMISIAHCAQSVKTIKGEKPGGDSVMAKFKWFNKKPVPLINRILKEYQKFEYELSLVLNEGEDIKNV